MTGRGSDLTAGGKTTLFDQLVLHERCAPAGSARSLRPRLPYPLEQNRDDDSVFDIEEVAVHGVRQYPTREPLPVERGDAGGKPAESPSPVAVGNRRQHDAMEEGLTARSPGRWPPPGQPAGANIIVNERIEMVADGLPPQAAPAKAGAESRRLADRGAALAEPQPMRWQQAAPPASRALAASRPKLILPGADRLGNGDQIVEIHIGRIDVRAAPTQVEAPPAAEAPPPVDRLTAYLQRRSRGARS